MVSLGCDLVEFAAALRRDFARADEAIRKRVTDLVDELVRAAGAKKH